MMAPGPMALGPAKALIPPKALGMLGVGGLVSLVALKTYAGVTAPEIPPGKLRDIAEVFRRLADDIDGGFGKNAGSGVADRADKLAASVWNHPQNSGEAIEAFRKLYQDVISGYGPQIAKDCRIVAIGCEAYAEKIDEVKKAFATYEDLIMQVVWLVTFQPMTTALYAFAVARIAALAGAARGIQTAFALNAAKIMEMTVPKYALPTLLYMAVDGAAYAAGSVTWTGLANATYDQPIGSVKENATEAGAIVGGNSAYVLGYDVAKAGLGNTPTTRGIEMGARLFGSAAGYTPVHHLISDKEQLMPTDDEWATKLTGHGLRAFIFPPGWTFKK